MFSNNIKKNSPKKSTSEPGKTEIDTENLFKAMKTHFLKTGIPLLLLAFLFPLLDESEKEREITWNTFVHDLLLKGRVYALESTSDKSSLIIHVKDTVTLNNLVHRSPRKQLSNTSFAHTLQPKPSDSSFDETEDIEDRSLLSSLSNNDPSKSQLNVLPTDSRSRRKAMLVRVSDWKIVEEKLDSIQDTAGVPLKDRLFVNYPSAPRSTFGSSTLSFLSDHIFDIAIFGLIFGPIIISRIRNAGKSQSGAPPSGGGGITDVFNFSRSNAQVIEPGTYNIRFRDVAGCDEAKTEVMEFVEYLKTPEKFSRLGAKLPTGLLLTGPPGTGKTLLAKATAGEAGVPLFAASGSEFNEMFVGVGAGRIRDLFKKARDLDSPAIIFIDEIDAIGQKRAKQGFRGNDERENTLNQLLVEMDGFDAKDHQIIVMAATNRSDTLDDALLRPGRFDRKVDVPSPDIRARRDIFNVHLRGLNLGDYSTHFNIEPPNPLVESIDKDIAALNAATNLIDSEESQVPQKSNTTKSESPDGSGASSFLPVDLEKLISQQEKDLRKLSSKLLQFSVGDEDKNTKEINDQTAQNEPIETGFVPNFEVDPITDRLAAHLATMTPGFSGAEIKNVCNEAALFAGRVKSNAIDMNHFSLALDRVIAGIEKNDRVVPPHERAIVANHEAGHAIVGWYLENADPLLKVSIVPRGSSALGYAQYLPKEGQLQTKEALQDMMAKLLGGRVAEDIVYNGSITTGASDDLQKVTRIAYSMVSKYGMSKKIGPISFPDPEGGFQVSNPFSDETSSFLDSEARILVSHGYSKARELIQKYREQHSAIVEKLLEKEILLYDDMLDICGPPPHGNHETVGDLFNQYFPEFENTDEKSSPSAS